MFLIQGVVAKGRGGKEAVRKSWGMKETVEGGRRRHLTVGPTLKVRDKEGGFNKRRHNCQRHMDEGLRRVHYQTGNGGSRRRGHRKSRETPKRAAGMNHPWRWTRLHLRCCEQKKQKSSIINDPRTSNHSRDGDGGMIQMGRDRRGEVRPQEETTWECSSHFILPRLSADT